jgi:hypothetical protein
MIEEKQKKSFNAGICARTKALREKREWSIDYTAKMLDIGVDAYSTYEKRTPIPHYLIPKFAAFMGVTIAYLLTGHDEKWTPNNPA